jgi:predicted transglutaminase-like cysteine proteinase
VLLGVLASSGCATNQLDSCDDLCKIELIKKEANENITYQSDMENYGVNDLWRIPKGNKMKGDCEDIALYIRQKAIRNGIASHRLKIGLCTTRWRAAYGMTDIDHAILIFDNQYVIDNNFEEIQSLTTYDACDVKYYYLLL